MKFSICHAATLAILASGVFAAADANATVVTDLTSGWQVVDTQAGGQASIVSLSGLGGNLDNNAPLPGGAVLLTTGADNNDKAGIGLSANFGTVGDFLANGEISFSYLKGSAGDLNAFAAPSLKLTVLDTSIEAGHGSDGYTTFVFEPSWNQPGFANVSHAVPTDDWIHVDVTGDSGLFWLTGIYGSPSIAAGGANLQKTIGDWNTALGLDDLLSAQILSISFGVGTYNQGQTGYIDNVHIVSGNFDETYDFEVAAANAVPEPGTLGLVGIGLLGLAFAYRRKQA
jgi:hypothetical protein